MKMTTESEKYLDKSTERVNNEDSKVTVPKKELIDALKWLAAAKRKLEALMK
jgi:hypothetical protein